MISGLVFYRACDPMLVRPTSLQQCVVTSAVGVQPYSLSCIMMSCIALINLCSRLGSLICLGCIVTTVEGWMGGVWKMHDS